MALPLQSPKTLTQVGFEPKTSGLVNQRSSNRAIQVLVAIATLSLQELPYRQLVITVIYTQS